MENERVVETSTPFSIPVPYSHVETGTPGEKPVIVYLHGYKQNMQYFQKKMKKLRQIRAHHIYLQGPYPVFDEKQKRAVEEWGRAWYLYDGNQQTFIHHLEKTASFVEHFLRDDVLPTIDYSRLALMGYSMGGYLAGYFALSRMPMVDDVAVLGARIKVELFADQSFDGLNVFALHGSNDTSVHAEPQQKSCQQLSAQGAKVHYQSIAVAHKLSDSYIQTARKWFIGAGYEVN